ADAEGPIRSRQDVQGSQLQSAARSVQSRRAGAAAEDPGGAGGALGRGREVDCRSGPSELRTLDARLRWRWHAIGPWGRWWPRGPDPSTGPRQSAREAARHAATSYGRSAQWRRRRTPDRGRSHDGGTEPPEGGAGGAGGSREDPPDEPERGGDERRLHPDMAS